MSSTLNATIREQLGSRHSRRLRAEGKIPGSLQAGRDKPHVNLAIDEEEFLSARRHHQHLYELKLGGHVETALVNHLTWDVFGDRIEHVEFRRVDRHAKTDVPVSIDFVGTPKSGLLVHLMNELTVRTTPDRIPDSVTVKVGALETGAIVTAAMVELPEGVELGTGVHADTPIARIAAPKVEVVEAPAAAAETAAPAAPAAEKKPDAKKP